MSMTSQPPPAPSALPLPSPVPRLNPADRIRVAVQAGCHPDSVERYLAGSAMQSTTIGRIERALRNLDLASIIDARARAVR
jgi:hypothetical protein